MAGVVVVRVPRTMTPESMAELAGAFGRPAGAFVVTGSESAFCLGADLKWLGGLSEPAEGVARLVAGHHEVVRSMQRAAVPVVTAVNGAAAGGGMSLALAGDYCLASAEARFTAAYFRLGLTPDGGNSAFLPGRLGAARAMELLLTNRSLAAEEALAWRLINEAVAPGELVSRASAVAEGFGGVPAETLVATRRLLQPSLEAALDEEEAAVTAAAKRPEFRRALREFLERSARSN